MIAFLKSYLEPRALFSNIRFYVLAINFIIAMAIFIFYSLTIPEETSRAIQFTQLYAFGATINLYIAILTTPLTKIFTNLPYSQLYLKARRAFGVSAFLFACMHVRSAFFDELGGFPGLAFLSSKYLIAISLSSLALLILFLMAATSFDFIIAKLSFKKWKKIHRLVYLAGLLIVIHALLLGSHYSDLSAAIPQISFALLIILIGLELFRFDQHLKKRLPNLPNFGITFAILTFSVGAITTYLFLPSSTVPSLGIHAAHIQLAQQAQQTSLSLPNSQNIPGLQGDRTKRYSVNFTTSQNIQPNQDANLTFTVTDASNGNPVNLYSTVYEKLVHLIIVDNTLTFFNHIHPTQQGNSFVITTQFPKAGRYHLYIDFQPLGAIEQQFSFIVDVGTVNPNDIPTQTADTNLTKTFGNYEVTLQKPDLVASELSIGNQKLSFTISDANNHQPITNLKPYLAAFGHLVMINTQTFDYLHVHPTNLFPPAPDANGGPTVEFLPLGIYGPIKTGIYRVFAQFNPDNKLFTSDFTVSVK